MLAVCEPWPIVSLALRVDAFEREVVHADQLVVAVAEIGVRRIRAAEAEIRAGTVRIDVHVAVDRADRGERGALPVDAGVEVADEDAFALREDAVARRAVPDRRRADECRRAIGQEFQHALAIDKLDVAALAAMCGFVVVELDDDGVQRVLHRRQHGVERTADRGREIRDERLLPVGEICDVRERSRRVHVEAARVAAIRNAPGAAA